MMQIDFHHAVTYVTARFAGFPHNEADVIAYAAQYVDDAVVAGPVCFNNGAMYMRISSAHKAIDLKNLSDTENHLVWLPFHFLPGNAGLGADSKVEGSFINKIVCLPDSPIAKDLVRAAIADHKKPCHLQRLGIAMHVYADTWAHQNFAGVLHTINDVDKIEFLGKEKGAPDWLMGFLHLEDAIPPLGHARANVFPDYPFLSWKYINGQGKEIERNNTEIFCDAATALCKAMQEYRRQDDPMVQVNGIGEKDMALIRRLFETNTDKEPDKRHR
jgi:hypothetical protein